MGETGKEFPSYVYNYWVVESERAVIFILMYFSHLCSKINHLTHPIINCGTSQEYHQSISIVQSADVLKKQFHHVHVLWDKII